MRFEAAAALAVIFGSIYTLLRKYQCVATLDDPTKQFNQPIIQSFIIFIGMTSIYFFKPFIPIEAGKPEKKKEVRLIYFLPSLLDVLGTIFDTAGLFYTSVSVSQMLKGSSLFFTYVISTFWLGKKITKNHHAWMLIIVTALGLIGYSNLNMEDSKFQPNPFFGNCLIILSQLIFAFLFVIEEKITKEYNIQVYNAVLWEGLWGVLISGVFLLIFSQLGSEVIKCDILDSCELVYNNFNLFIALLFTALSIAPFNYFGLSITKQTSALQRCMICTSRMVSVWIISLILHWQSFSALEFAGYCLLTFGIYKFNNLGIEEDLKDNDPDERENIIGNEHQIEQAKVALEQNEKQKTLFV